MEIIRRDSRKYEYVQAAAVIGAGVVGYKAAELARELGVPPQTIIYASATMLAMGLACHYAAHKIRSEGERREIHARSLTRTEMLRLKLLESTGNILMGIGVGGGLAGPIMDLKLLK